MNKEHTNTYELEKSKDKLLLTIRMICLMYLENTKLIENIAKTTEVIHDISISSSEQRTSIEQINDVVNRLDRQTQNNASIATQTQDIAINTSNIAKKILETVNEKEFRNK